MPGLATYQAVLLAGGEDKRLHPLTGPAGAVKALLPVANKPLISYPLKALSEAGLKHVFIVVSGDKPAAAIQSWVTQEYSGPDKMQCEIVTVGEDHGTADALRAVANKITASTVVVLSGDLLIDLPVNALVASHLMNAALATVLLYKRKVSPMTETKPGKAPKNVDYIGLDPSREHLLFYASSPDTLRDLKIPLAVVRRHGSMTIADDLADAHLYVFNKSLLALLSAQPSLASLRQDLLPFLTQQQLRLRPLSSASPQQEQSTQDGREPSNGASTAESQAVGEGDAEEGPATSLELPGAQYMDMVHVDVEQQAQSSSALRVHIVQPGNYCARVADVASYGDVNREVADSSIALHLAGLRPSVQHDNVVPASTVTGSKTTIAAGCVLGEGCVLGDKASIKRSVLGNNVKLGVNAKVINSVIHDSVVVGDGVTVQNTILCSGVVVREKATLKDCQVASGFTISAGIEHKGEVLAKKA